VLTVVIGAVKEILRLLDEFFDAHRTTSEGDLPPGGPSSARAGVLNGLGCHLRHGEARRKVHDFERSPLARSDQMLNLEPEPNLFEPWPR
jgi:hypothetical protein